MAKNEIKVNITAETTQFERNIASLKKKLGEAFITPTQFSIGALSPWKMASDFIIKKGLEIIDSFKNWRKGLEDIATATDRTAKDLDTTTLQASHLYATIRSYCQTREAIEAISAAPNASYSIAGRSFTKANLADLKKHLEPLAETLAEYLPAFRAIHRSTTPAFHGVRF